MADLIEQIEEAERNLHELRRKKAAESCAVVGHEWGLLGGRNACCSNDCSCSVPVNTCAKCGDCDYGDNEEARRIVKTCEESDNER